MLAKYLSYLLIPHEYLHVIAYHLMKKKVQYQWGDPYVKLLDPVSRKERIIGLLFPFVVCAIVSFILFILFDVALYYYLYGNILIVAMVGMMFFGLLGLLMVYNTLVSVDDLHKAYRLFKKQPLQPSPFLLKLARPRPLTSERKLFFGGVIAISFILLLILKKP